MKVIKLKDLKTGDIAKSINIPDAPDLLIIGVNKITGVKHAIFGDAKIEIDEYDHAWNSDVLLKSENNDVSNFKKIHRLRPDL